MRLRLIGLPEEVTAAAERIGRVLDVIETSDAYPCRGTSRQVRTYLETRLTAAHAVPGRHEQRERVIAGLRDLADFLEINAEVPARRDWSFQYTATAFTTSYADACAEVDRVAGLLRVAGGRPWPTAHYQANRSFGPITYHAVAVARPDEPERS